MVVFLKRKRHWGDAVLFMHPLFWRRAWKRRHLVKLWWVYGARIIFVVTERGRHLAAEVVAREGLVVNTFTIVPP